MSVREDTEQFLHLLSTLIGAGDEGLVICRDVSLGDAQLLGQLTAGIFGYGESCRWPYRIIRNAPVATGLFDDIVARLKSWPTLP